MTNVLGPADVIRNGWRVIRQVNPPATSDDKDSYDAWPLTDAASQQTGLTTTTNIAGVHHHIWVVRHTYGTGSSKPNNLFPAFNVTGGGGKNAGIDYTTMAKAIMALKAIVAHSLGWSLGDIETLVASEFADTDIYGYNDAVTNSAAIFTDAPHGATWTAEYLVATDIIVLPNVRIVDVTAGRRGLFLDWERGDNIPGADALSLVEWVKDECTTADIDELILYTNHHTDNTANGWTATVLDNVINKADIFAFVCDTDSGTEQALADYREGIAAIKTAYGSSAVPFNKIAPIIDMSVAFNDIANVMRAAEVDGCRKVVTWRNGVTDGGSDPASASNRKNALVACNRGGAAGAASMVG